MSYGRYRVNMERMGQGGQINEVICVQRVATDAANEDVTIIGYSVTR